MEHYLIDTNAVSDHLSSLFPPNGMLLLDDVINNVPNLSVISQIEFLCWNVANDTKAEHIRQFLADAPYL